jgi:hypothetical protein
MSAFLRMPVSPRATLAIVALALFVSLGIGREAPPPAPPPAPAPAAAPADLDLGPLQRARLGERTADPFARPAGVATLAAAPSAQQARAAVQAPAPPSLPYSFLGRIVDGNKSTLYLARGEQQYAAEAGAILDGQYQIEQVGPSAIQFIYLPLGTRHTLPLPAPE